MKKSNLKVFDSNPEKLNKFFGAQGMPGQAIGMTINEVKEGYVCSRKIYTQNTQLQTGANTNLIANLPSSARFLIGISYYSNFDNAAESPQLNYTLNNSIIIQKTPVRSILIDNLQSQVYYPLGLPLSGNDTHEFDILEVGNQKISSLIFHYI